MNKIALALVLTLGTANVSAVVETKPTVDANLDARIKSLNLSEENKSAVMQLMSNNKMATTVIGLALAASIFVGVDCLYNKGYADSLTKQGLDAVFRFLDQWVKTPVAYGWNTYGFGSVKGADDVVTHGTLRAHPCWTGATVAAAVILIYTIYDLRKEEDKSELKKLYKKYVSKQAIAA